MATQNAIKAKSEESKRAVVRAKYGQDTVDALDEIDVSDDWRDVQAFAQEHVSYDD